jgi:hypothetical protein
MTVYKKSGLRKASEKGNMINELKKVFSKTALALAALNG